MSVSLSNVGVCRARATAVSHVSEKKNVDTRSVVRGYSQCGASKAVLLFQKNVDTRTGGAAGRGVGPAVAAAAVHCKYSWRPGPALVPCTYKVGEITVASLYHFI